MLGQWTPNTADKKRIARQGEIAARNKVACKKGAGQYVGRPGGPKAKGAKTPATGLLPVTRFSVIPNGATNATHYNALRARDLRKARNKRIRAAKNSVQ
jgi:hypothetical protein